MNNFKLMKVFDCQDMPDNLKKIFMSFWDNVGNDCAKEWYMHDSDPPEPESDKIDTWLMENGAEFGEHVMIKHWW